MKWIDLENDPAPQWVGDMAQNEVCDGLKYFPKNWSIYNATFKALCKRIYRTEPRPVDPDFERIRGVASVILYNLGYPTRSHDIESGKCDDVVEAALAKWNETVAS